MSLLMAQNSNAPWKNPFPAHRCLTCIDALVFCTLPNLLSFPSRSYLKRKGVVVNETTVLLYGQLLTGRKYVPKANGVVELEKQWSKQVLPLAYQTVVKVMLLRAE